ncbi:hypothetical protein OQA88_11783 [Cercophora sp. LCS_1]
MRLLLPLLAALPGLTHALKVAANPAWIEGTPFAYANKYMYKTESSSVTSGGVASLSNKDIEIAGNAETQGLKQYVSHKNYRLIYIVVEVTYRLVGNKLSGIRTLADFKGKKIGTISGSSAEVFVRMLLSSAGLANGDYSTGSGSTCMRAPCGANTLPQMLKDKKLDGFGVWETAVELGIEALGDNAVVFKNATLYREIYSLYATTESLADTKRRKKIVEYVKALNTTLALFKEKPEEVYPFVSQTIGVDVPVLRKVWEDHVWGPGDMGEGLVDFLVREDAYLAKADKRSAHSRKELEKFIDTSVYEEALKL